MMKYKVVGLNPDEKLYAYGFCVKEKDIIKLKNDALKDFKAVQVYVWDERLKRWLIMRSSL